MKETDTLPADMRPARLFFRLPFDRINWITSSFLIGTLVLALTAVPVLYLVLRA